MTETSLVQLVSSWFLIPGTLLVGGSLGRLGARLGYRKLDQLGAIWDIDLLGDLLGARSEDCSR